MKRAVSISLSVLLLYNAVGYYLLYLYASQQSRIAMVATIPEPALQVVKFNLALYNPVPDTEAEWVDEEWRQAAVLRGQRQLRIRYRHCRRGRSGFPRCQHESK